MVFKPFRAGPGYRCSVTDKIVEVEGDLLETIASQKGDVVLSYGASDPRCLVFRTASFLSSCAVSIAPILFPQVPPIVAGVSILTWGASVWWRNNDHDLLKKQPEEAVPSANIEYAVFRLASSKEQGPGLCHSFARGVANGMRCSGPVLAVSAITALLFNGIHAMMRDPRPAIQKREEKDIFHRDNYARIQKRTARQEKLYKSYCRKCAAYPDAYEKLKRYYARKDKIKAMAHTIGDPWTIQRSGNTNAYVIDRAKKVAERRQRIRANLNRYFST